ncbi:MAG: hypothetical protein GC206_10940 [Alphaproteobacteria bacterium]|nr:hypothetical protein [Alphaproteobacteria bacterium]
MRNDVIEMNDGREICLERLSQALTYAGLLEGTPTTALNQRYLAGVMERAAGSCSQPTLLLEPRQRRVVIPGRNAEFGWLPRIVCEGLFVSYRFARDRSADVSYLRIIWLQGEFALPIAADALAQIKAIDWVANAADGWT